MRPQFVSVIRSSVLASIMLIDRKSGVARLLSHRDPGPRTTCTEAGECTPPCLRTRKNSWPILTRASMQP